MKDIDWDNAGIEETEAFLLANLKTINMHVEITKTANRERAFVGLLESAKTFFQGGQVTRLFSGLR